MTKNEMENLIKSLTPRQQKQLLRILMETMDQAAVIEVITKQQAVSKEQEI